MLLIKLQEGAFDFYSPPCCEQLVSNCCFFRLPSRSLPLYNITLQLVITFRVVQALALAVEVETLARQYTIATAGGQPTLLSDAEMSVILAKFKTYGKQPDELVGLGTFDKMHAVIPPPRRDLPPSKL